jgi:SAM-dependent methyltransferase
MLIDIRYEAAKYYDLQPSPFDGQDIRFYLDLLQAYPNASGRVLELGCGTGRVLLPLAARCAYIYGVDLSEAMLDLCRAKLARAAIPSEHAQVQHGDITALDLGQTFDLITAPFRVMQNLETDEQLDGLFVVIRRHLTPGGSCVLNAFRPWGDEVFVREKWASRQREEMNWEVPVGNGRLAFFDKILRVHPTEYICYPRLIYRYSEGDEIKDEAVLDIAMRAYTPQDFERLILDHDFRIVGKWGGYNNEVYGEGPELVVRFSL